jgi:8-oxo-dGTP diphosphatase
VSVVHLIRHAKAKNRLEWSEPDDVRPLTKRGRREASRSRRGFSRIRRTGSSRARTRGIQTLEPLALALDLAIETTDELAEGPAEQPRSSSCSR